jgi:aspartate/methionine/tyrosine aminotransferase
MSRCNGNAYVHQWHEQRYRYGDSLGDSVLRERIAEKLYSNVDIKAAEVVVSDGSKPDIGRMQAMFGPGITVAAQVRCSSVRGV